MSSENFFFPVREKLTFLLKNSNVIKMTIQKRLLNRLLYKNVRLSLSNQPKEKDAVFTIFHVLRVEFGHGTCPVHKIAPCQLLPIYFILNPSGNFRHTYFSQNNKGPNILMPFFKF